VSTSVEPRLNKGPKNERGRKQRNKPTRKHQSQKSKVCLMQVTNRIMISDMIEREHGMDMGKDMGLAGGCASCFTSSTGQARVDGHLTDT